MVSDKLCCCRITHQNTLKSSLDVSSTHFLFAASFNWPELLRSWSCHGTCWKTNKPRIDLLPRLLEKLQIIRLLLPMLKMDLMMIENRDIDHF